MLIGAQVVSVWLVAQATDMRKSIDGLAQLVVDALARQPVSGEVFAFSNRGHDKVKLLWYDRTGFWLAYKRLERGRFRWPQAAGEIGLSDLYLLLEGVDLGRARFRRVPVQQVD
jgi:transposase